MLGCMVGEGELPGADGINGSLRLWTDATHSSSVSVTCGTAPYVCKHGPGFDNYQVRQSFGMVEMDPLLLIDHIGELMSESQMADPGLLPTRQQRLAPVPTPRKINVNSPIFLLCPSQNQ